MEGKVMAAGLSLSVLSKFRSNSDHKPSFRVKAQISGDKPKTMVRFSGTTEPVDGLVSLVRDKLQKGNDGLGHEMNDKVRVEKKIVKCETFSEMELLWDDGYDSKSVKDFFTAAKEITRNDSGSPRWFIPEDCDGPIKDAPTLMFLPGIDGTGLGLIMHHKAIGMAFHIRCLHIPIHDRTPFDGLVKLVEEALRQEHASSPDKPIYLLGDSVGGCLALAVAARNPHIDMVLILVNPATSFERSQLQPLLPILELLPEELHLSVPYALSLVMGDPLKMSSVDINTALPTSVRLEQLRDELFSLLPLFSVLGEIVPKETLLWKLKLLKTGAAYANSRLHAVKAEVLVLAGGKDNILPSQEEAKRLQGLLKNCIIRVFKDNGHALLLEDSFSLLTVIKGTCKYRRSRRYNYVSDFLLLSKGEFEYATSQLIGLLRYAVGSVMYSTMEDGRIVKGLAGVPDEGPVLLVGYHMLMGLELGPMSEAFVKEKRILFRGMAHPLLFSETELSKEFSYNDWFKVFGAYPVTPSNLFKLLASKSHVLLYPGGIREALHNRGEEYKLIWPERQEFVRMAARFGAVIVPFGNVGEDDITDLVLDYNDLMKIPFVNSYVREANRDFSRFRLRDESGGEVANQNVYIPGLLPKIPGRFYYLFGKPIHTKGREDLVKDKEAANSLYLHVKAEVERSISYLLKKREEDPYRSIVDRVAYSMTHTPAVDVPSFDP